VVGADPGGVLALTDQRTVSSLLGQMIEQATLAGVMPRCRSSWVTSLRWAGGQDHCQGDAGGVGDQVVFAAQPAPVDRAGTGVAKAYTHRAPA
jgi:hypothetical protein